MLDAGTYRARAIEAALGETETGKEQIAVQFQLLDLEGQQITWYGYFTEKTLETTFKALRTAGWKGQDLTDLSDLCAPAETPEVHLIVEHETYENPQTGETKTRARVRWVNGTGGLALKKALDPNKAKAFAARMRGQIVAFDRSSGAPKANGVAKPHPADAEPSPFNDDIPF
jgi:hypothetical protein